MRIGRTDKFLKQRVEARGVVWFGLELGMDWQEADEVRVIRAVRFVIFDVGSHFRRGPEDARVWARNNGLFVFTVELIAGGGWRSADSLYLCHTPCWGQSLPALDFAGPQAPQGSNMVSAKFLHAAQLAGRFVDNRCGRGGVENSAGISHFSSSLQRLAGD